ncbi:hypothetical protein B5P45_03955 [Phyllobacterium zundukense]|uniref:Uncharacterized protein n=1 Tax=Phyllobacterium zundukense TaxID=1867719 RepID=A0A2N9W341_9HYPH|nr:hypothetical protein BLM14_21450 [Phyllobacterium zundukense]PIO46159.1 hypothetical protein B5P45_03955 [Phyllobacterium zundukense]
MEAAREANIYIGRQKGLTRYSKLCTSAYLRTSQGLFASRRILRLYTALSRVLQTKFAPGFLALFTLPVTFAQQPFRLTSVDISESLSALMPFFSNAAVQAAIERGLSEVACALVQSKMLHKGATATRRLFTNPSIVCNPAKSTRFRLGQI